MPTSSNSKILQVECIFLLSFFDSPYLYVHFAMPCFLARIMSTFPITGLVDRHIIPSGSDLWYRVNTVADQREVVFEVVLRVSVAQATPPWVPGICIYLLTPLVKRSSQASELYASLLSASYPLFHLFFGLWSRTFSFYRYSGPFYFQQFLFPT